MDDALSPQQRRYRRPPAEKGFGLAPDLKAKYLSNKVSIDDVEIPQLYSINERCPLRKYLEQDLQLAHQGFLLTRGKEIALFHKSNGYIRTATVEELRSLALSGTDFIDRSIAR